MNIYKVTVDVFVSAESEQDAVNTAAEELDYLCNMDSATIAFAYDRSRVELHDIAAQVKEQNL